MATVVEKGNEQERKEREAALIKEATEHESTQEVIKLRRVAKQTKILTRLPNIVRITTKTKAVDINIVRYMAVNIQSR